MCSSCSVLNQLQAWDRGLTNTSMKGITTIKARTTLSKSLNHNKDLTLDESLSVKKLDSTDLSWPVAKHRHSSKLQRQWHLKIKALVCESNFYRKQPFFILWFRFGLDDLGCGEKCCDALLCWSVSCSAHEADVKFTERLGRRRHCHSPSPRPKTWFVKWTYKLRLGGSVFCKT